MRAEFLKPPLTDLRVCVILEPYGVPKSHRIALFRNNMQEPAAATIIRIDVHILTVRFDDPLIARGEIMLKPSDIESIQYMKPARASYF